MICVRVEWAIPKVGFLIATDNFRVMFLGAYKDGAARVALVSEATSGSARTPPPSLAETMLSCKLK